MSLPNYGEEKGLIVIQSTSVIGSGAYSVSALWPRWRRTFAEDSVLRPSQTTLQAPSQALRNFSGLWKFESLSRR
eukprot:scaffold24_cov245-Pinguiococcus_pyrenoidosus.AAC.24